MAKNFSKRKNYRKDFADEECYDMFPNPRMSSMSPDVGVCTNHIGNSSGKANCSYKCEMSEGLATSTMFKAGTKPNLSFQTSRKVGRDNGFNLKIHDKYDKHINASIRKYEENWENFHLNYLLWRKERLNTISKLKDLMKKVHDDQLAYNETNITLKELNVNSRMLKDSNNSLLDCFASLGTFLTDAACGITSVAQAFNTDECNTEFKKIMENDAEITKPLYVYRSRCLEHYRDVEEVVRCFHCETFVDTMGTMSKTLKFEELWLDIKNAQAANPISSTINCLERFISKNIHTTNISKVYNSLGEYIESNPATLDACKSAGKIAFGIYDTLSTDQKQRTSIKANTSSIVNKMIMAEEMKELRQLRLKVNNSEMNQTVLESKIEEAIDSLQFELNDISSLFNN